MAESGHNITNSPKPPHTTSTLLFFPKQQPTNYNNKYQH